MLGPNRWRTQTASNDGLAQIPRCPAHAVARRHAGPPYVEPQVRLQEFPRLGPLQCVQTPTSQLPAMAGLLSPLGLCYGLE
jgi:hypothetical protein